MSKKRETDVLVVGAGPVGLFTALSLVEQGVNVTILDKHWRTHGHSYALALHPGTLRLLQDLELDQELVGSGHVVHELKFYEGASQRIEVDLSKLDAECPHVAIVPQSSLEWALENWLKKRGVDVLWNHEVTELHVDGGSVRAQVTRYDKESLGYPVARTEWVAAEQFQIGASQLVGADGYHSRVRQQMEIDYPSFGDSQLFSLMEFTTQTDLGGAARIVIDDRSTNVLWPMSKNRYRWTFQIDEPSDHSPTAQRLTELTQERAPWFDAEGISIVWASAVRFERRLASHFATSNVWLAGDAGHLTGPVGVQSMNVGLREGRDVAGRIAEVLQGANFQDLADPYDSERQREWGRLLDRGGELQCSQDSDSWLSEHRHEILSCVPASGGDLEDLLRQAGLDFA